MQGVRLWALLTITGLFSASASGGAAGQCDAGDETCIAALGARPAGSYGLPPCVQEFNIDTFAEGAKSWCNPAHLPAAVRPPTKMQGLFWLRGLPLPDVAACFSTAPWNAETLTLNVSIWDHFAVENSFGGRSLIAATWLSKAYYLIKFTNSSLSEAEITPHGHGLSLVEMAFKHVASFPFIELQDGLAPGDVWARPSYVGWDEHKVLTNQYEAARVLDGDMQVVQGQEQSMRSLLHMKMGGMLILRYSEDCVAQHDQHEGGNCEQGIFIGLAKQVTLGLKHFAVTQKIAFAQLMTNKCAVEYSVTCEDGRIVVEEESICTKGRSPGPAGGLVAEHGGLEVCAASGHEVRLLLPVLDLTWDAEVPAKIQVEGCIQVKLANDLPSLSGMRGNAAIQKDAIIAKKKEIRGCPFFASPQDRLDRADDFATSKEAGPIFAAMAKTLKGQFEARAKLWTTSPPGTALGWIDSAKDLAQVGAGLALFAGPGHENRSLVFPALAHLNCGEPSVFMDGPMVHRHKEVAKAVTDVNMARSYQTGTIQQHEDCFDPTLPLFQSSGSQEHTQARQLLDEAGWETMHLAPLPDIGGEVQKSVMDRLKEYVGGARPPSDIQVGKFVVPVLLQMVLGVTPTPEEVDLFADYLVQGKKCIFGARSVQMKLLSRGRLQQIRKTMQNLIKHSPKAKVYSELLGKPKYAALKRAYATRGDAEDTLHKNIADALLFAGVLGTSDMTHKCVAYQYKDKSHLRMFRKDPKAYLHELMRFDGAVTSVTGTMTQTENWRLEGINVDLPKGTGIQYVFASANRDASVFPQPSRFVLNRPEIGESLSWNGKLQDVMARNYSGAPRFCPGYHLSMKIAEGVCSHLTDHLKMWGTEAPVNKDNIISGAVKILAAGHHQGSVGIVSYFDSHSSKYCVIDKHRPGLSLGCYARAHLHVVDPAGGVARTLQEELAQCPSFASAGVQMLLRGGARAYQMGIGRSAAVEQVLGKTEVPELMTSDWADDYLVALYMGITSALRMYASRHSNSVMVPTKIGKVPTFRVEHIVAPNADIDHPHFMPIEWYVPDALYDIGFLTSFNCFQSTLRTLPWDDQLEDDVQNSWSTIFAKARGNYSRKAEFVHSFFKPYSTLDGTPIWPRQEYDLGALYWKQDTWNDGLERAIAFGQIGSHRVLEVCGQVEHWRGVRLGGVAEDLCIKEPFRGEQLRFVVPLNIYSQLEVRPGFGKYGGDMFFNADGMPIVIRTPDGKMVAKGDRDWQYWKFVWRSSLITVITLVDHLHTAHFQAANILANSIRRTLSPNHPFRRLNSIFSFGSIFVNMNALHTLIGPRHALHRSSPFKNFEGLSDLVPTQIPLLGDLHKAILDEGTYRKLPPLLQQAPYFQDGRLLVEAIKELQTDFLKLYSDQFCKPDGTVTDPEMQNLWDELLEENARAGYKSSGSGSVANCTIFANILLPAVWTVTGWHRHVGTVGDYYIDPDLASFSWKEGEPYSRPKQHLIMAQVAAFTSTSQPKLNEDYSHVFRGVEHEEQALAIMAKFRRNLQTVHDEVSRRNELRFQTWGYKNIHADPEIVECSVAV